MIVGATHRIKIHSSSTCARVMTLLVMLISFQPSAAAVSQEYQVKAALIYKLTKFISWPQGALENNSHFGICLLGNDVFGAAMNELESRNTKGKPIKVMRFQQSNDITTQCQVVFIEQSKRAFLTPILTSLDPYSILTIGDFKGFAEQRGILEFRTVKGRTEFTINLSSLENANLQASAPLLGLAKTISHHPKGKTDG